MSLPAASLVRRGIQPYGGTNFDAVGTMDTVAELATLDLLGLATGYTVNVAGYGAAGDAGGGLFRLDLASVEPVDNGLVFATSGAGRWVRLHDGQISVRWFGAAGDGAADDTAAINAAIVAANLLAVALGGQIRVFFNDGTYLTDGILIQSGVWLDLGAASIKKRTDGGTAATGSIIRALENLTGGSYYGTYADIRISGGFLYGNGHTCPAHMVRLMYVDRLVVENVVVAQYSANIWAFCIGGRNVQVRGCRTIGGADTNEDGIHIVHGQFITVNGCDIESGDDALAVGAGVADPYLSVDPDPIRYVSIADCVVNSLKAVAVKIFVENGALGTDWEVTDVTVSNITGKCGVNRNGGLVVYDLNATPAGTSQIQRVNLSNISLDVGSTANDETNPYGLWLSSVKNIAVSNVSMKITDKTGAAVGFVLAYITACENIGLSRLRCNALQRRSGISVDTSKYVTIANCFLRATAATVGGNPIKLVDVVGADLHSNIILDVPDGSYGILFNTGTLTEVKIRGNRIAQVAGAATGGAIVVGSGAFVHVVLVDNDLSGCVAAINAASFAAGPAYLVANNRGFITRAQGAATVLSGTTSIVVNHGLGMTPALSQIQVVPTNNLGAATKFWISTPTATQFTINVDANPGAPTATFAWLADVGKKPA